MSNTNEQGLSLLDLAPQWELVQVSKTEKLKVGGVTAEGILALFNRFPEMQEWIATRKVSIKDLAAKTPQALAAIIAAACGSPGNAEAEAVAAALSLDTQLDILEVVARLTFKNGFGPFVNRIVQLADLARSANYGKAADTSLHQASRRSPPPGMESNPSGD